MLRICADRGLWLLPLRLLNPRYLPALGACFGETCCGWKGNQTGTNPCRGPPDLFQRPGGWRQLFGRTRATKAPGFKPGVGGRGKPLDHALWGAVASSSATFWAFFLEIRSGFTSHRAEQRAEPRCLMRQQARCREKKTQSKGVAPPSDAKPNLFASKYPHCFKSTRPAGSIRWDRGPASPSAAARPAASIDGSRKPRRLAWFFCGLNGVPTGRGQDVNVHKKRSVWKQSAGGFRLRTKSL